MIETNIDILNIYIVLVGHEQLFHFYNPGNKTVYDEIRSIG